MRKEFWESRVDGSPEMYFALRNVCEAILNNESELADAILEVKKVIVKLCCVYNMYTFICCCVYCWNSNSNSAFYLST